jgi:hypothetical protein
MNDSSRFDDQLGRGALLLTDRNLNCKDFERILRKLSVKSSRRDRPIGLILMGADESVEN